MSQRVLFSILSAVLFAACEDDTIVSLNAVTFTKSHLSDVAESARHAAERTDILAARLAVFSDSTIAFSGSVIAFYDSATVAAVLLAAADYDLRVTAAAASSFFRGQKDESRVIEEVAARFATYHAHSASEAYEVARRTAFAAYVAAAAAYDARRTRLASKAYEVVRRTADETAAISRRATDQAAAAKATQAAARVAARQAAAAADSLQAAAEVAQTTTAARRAAAKAAEAAKVYATEVARLRRAYNKDAVQAAYDVATAAAYATAYEAYRAGACRAAQYAAVQADLGTAYADTRTYDHLADAICGASSISPYSKAAIQAARTAYVTYVDSAAYAAAYDAAHALFNAAYAPDSSDPQTAAAEAYAAAAAEAARRGKNKAVRDSAYVTLPISTATAALATSKAAYQTCATYIDSLLNSIE